MKTTIITGLILGAAGALYYFAAPSVDQCYQVNTGNIWRLSGDGWHVYREKYPSTLPLIGRRTWPGWGLSEHPDEPRLVDATQIACPTGYWQLNGTA